MYNILIVAKKIRERKTHEATPKLESYCLNSFCRKVIFLVKILYLDFKDTRMGFVPKKCMKLTTYFLVL